MGTALIKFRQGTTIGADGEALVVEATATAVFIENYNSVDIQSYLIELLYVPPACTTYTVVPGTPVILAQANGTTPSASLDVSEESVYGCFRVRMTVWPQANQGGVPDVDIRNVAILTPNEKFVLFAPQLDPLPLPSSGSGAKPNEFNFGGQPFGWAGGTDENVRGLNDALMLLDAPSGGSTDPDYESEQLVVTGNETRTVGQTYDIPLASIAANEQQNIGIYVHTTRIASVTQLSECGGCTTIDVTVKNDNGTYRFSGGTYANDGEPGTFNRDAEYAYADVDLEFYNDGTDDYLRVNIYAIEAYDSYARVQVYLGKKVTWAIL